MFESIAVLTTVSLAAVFAFLVRMEYRGRQQDNKARQCLHRGIAARQFQRTFVLADGMEVLGADLNNGLLAIDLARPEPERLVKTIAYSKLVLPLLRLELERRARAPHQGLVNLVPVEASTE